MKVKKHPTSIVGSALPPGLGKPTQAPLLEVAHFLPAPLPFPSPIPQVRDYLLEFTHTSPDPTRDLTHDAPLPAKCVPYLLITNPPLWVRQLKKSRINQNTGPHTNPHGKSTAEISLQQKTLQRPYWPSFFVVCLLVLAVETLSDETKQNPVDKSR